MSLNTGKIIVCHVCMEDISCEELTIGVLGVVSCCQCGYLFGGDDVSVLRKDTFDKLVEQGRLKPPLEEDASQDM